MGLVLGKMPSEKCSTTEGQQEEKAPSIRTNVSRETFPESLPLSERKESLLAEIRNEEDLLAFQAKLWNLLDKRVKLYTSGESSSVPKLLAHEMLASVLFVLGLEGDNLDLGELQGLSQVNLDEEFTQRLKAIREKTKQVGELWKEVVVTTPLLESRALKNTLNSLKNFEAQYNPQYFAHEIPGDIDYPLCAPVPEHYQGVIYVREYLQRLKLENNFLNTFDIALCKALLKRVSSDYRELILNLYEPIATNAIGLALAEGEPRTLQVEDADRAKITRRFKGLSAKKAEALLIEAADSVCKKLRIDNSEEKAYLQSFACTLHPRIKVLIAKEDLSGVFLSFKLTATIR